MSIHSSLRPQGLVVTKQTAGQARSAARKRRNQAANRAWWQAKAAQLGIASVAAVVTAHVRYNAHVYGVPSQPIRIKAMPAGATQ